MTGVGIVACLCVASGGLLVILHVGDAGAAGNAAAGKAKTRLCQACHNPDGNSPRNPMWERLTTADLTGQGSVNDSLRRNPIWPKLAGQNPAYLARQLHLFKAGVRKNPLMSAMVTELTDADIDDIAAYYASQRAKPDPTMASAEVIGRGRDLYQRGNAPAGVPACMTCHGSTAHGTEELPRLAGQHEVYLKKQLWAFKVGQRTSPVMSPVASRLTEADIDSVAAYLSTLE